MLAKKFALAFGIAVLLPFLVYYGVSTFSPPPKHDWTCYRQYVIDNTIMTLPKQNGKKHDKIIKKSKKSTIEKKNTSRGAYFMLPHQLG